MKKRIFLHLCILLLLSGSRVPAMENPTYEEVRRIETESGIHINNLPYENRMLYYTGKNIVAAEGSRAGPARWYYCVYPEFLEEPPANAVWKDLGAMASVDFRREILERENGRAGVYFLKTAQSREILKIIAAELIKVETDQEMAIVDNRKYPVKITCLFNPDLRNAPEQPEVKYYFTKATETGAQRIRTLIHQPGKNAPALLDEYVGPPEIRCSWDEPGSITINAEYQGIPVTAEIPVCQLNEIGNNAGENILAVPVNANDSDNNGQQDVQQIAMDNNVHDPDLMKVRLSLPVNPDANIHNPIEIRTGLVDKYLTYLHDNNVTLTLRGAANIRLFSGRNKGEGNRLVYEPRAEYTHHFSEHTLDENYAFLNNLYVEGIPGMPPTDELILTFKQGEDEIFKAQIPVIVPHIRMNYTPSLRQILASHKNQIPPDQRQRNYLLPEDSLDIIYNPAVAPIDVTSHFVVEERNNLPAELHSCIEWRIAGPARFIGLDILPGGVESATELSGLTITLKGTRPGHAILQVGTKGFSTPYIEYLVKIDHLKRADFCFNIFSNKPDIFEEFPGIENFMQEFPSSIKMANIILRQAGVKLQYLSQDDFVPENGLTIGMGNSDEMKVPINRFELLHLKDMPGVIVDTGMDPFTVISRKLPFKREFTYSYRDRVKIVDSNDGLHQDNLLVRTPAEISHDLALFGDLKLPFPAGAKLQVDIPQEINVDLSNADEGILIYRGTPDWIIRNEPEAAALMGHQKYALNINLLSTTASPYEWTRREPRNIEPENPENDDNRAFIVHYEWARGNIYCNPEATSNPSLFWEGGAKRNIKLPRRPYSFYKLEDSGFNTVTVNYKTLRVAGRSLEENVFALAYCIAKEFLLSTGINERKYFPPQLNDAISRLDGVKSVGYLPEVDVEPLEEPHGNLNNIAVAESPVFQAIDIDLLQAEVMSGSWILKD